MRGRYSVALEYEDGTRHVVTVWAESPEHAEKKAKSRAPDGPIVDSRVDLLEQEEEGE